jgi:DNA-directed RNA polymerase subunit RPC12/RpoP
MIAEEIKCPTCGSDRRYIPKSAYPNQIPFKKQHGHTYNLVYMCLKCGTKYSVGPNGKVYLVKSR